MDHDIITAALAAFIAGILITAFVYEVWMGVAVDEAEGLIMAHAKHPAQPVQPALYDIEAMLREKLGAEQITDPDQLTLDEVFDSAHKD